MLVTIESDGETFTADSIAAAKKLERKAKREEAKRSAREHADAEKAYLYAQSNGWSILERHLKGEKFPRGWRFHLPGSRFSPCKLDESSSGLSHRVYLVDAEHGRGRFQLWTERDVLVGTVESGAGFCRAIIVGYTDSDGAYHEKCMAVGVSNDQLRFADCPTITKELFHEGE